MKLDKKLGLVMIFVALALVSAGIVEAATFKEMLSGLKSIFHYKILINALVIGGIAYLLLPLIYKKTESKEGHVASLVIISILSLVIASNIGPTLLWEEGMFGKKIITFLFGENGLLTYENIGIFVASSVLLVWFFKFLNVGGQGEEKSKVTWALAIVISTKLARTENFGTQQLVLIGMVITTVIVWRSLLEGPMKNIQGKDGKDTSSFWAFIAAFLLVGFVGYIISPESGFWAFRYILGIKTTGAGGPFLKRLAGFFGNWGMWVIIALFLLIAGIVKWGKGGEERFREDKTRFLHEGFTRIGNWFRDLVRNRDIPLLWRLLKKREIIDREIAEQIPKSWEDLTVLLHVFYNWILRLEVFTTKRRVVARAEEDTKKIEKEVMTDTKDIGNIRSDTKMYKEGSEIVNDENGGFKLGAHYAPYTRTTGRWSKKKIPISHGALNMEWFVLKFLTLFKNELEAGKNRLKIRKDISADERLKLQKSVIEANMKPLKAEFIKDRDTRFWGAHNRYCHWHRIRSLRNVILDQYRMYGKYFHSYKFANVNAPVYKYDYDRKKAFEGNPLDRKVEPTDKIETWWEKKKREDENVLKKRPENQFGIPLLHEVDHKGVFVEDRNAILVEDERLPYVRRIIPTKTNIVDHEDSHEIMDWQIKEWDAFLDDLRFGTYHPHSLTFEHYKQCMDEKDFAFKNVEKRQVSMMVGPENPAFDFEALKDPILIYWGRKKYYEENNYTINTGESVNPFPTISTLGISKFIAAYIQRKTNPVTAKEFLTYLVGDSGLKVDNVFALLSELPTEKKE